MRPPFPIWRLIIHTQELHRGDWPSERPNWCHLLLLQSCRQAPSEEGNGGALLPLTLPKRRDACKMPPTGAIKWAEKCSHPHTVPAAPVTTRSQGCGATLRASCTVHRGGKLCAQHGEHLQCLQTSQRTNFSESTVSIYSPCSLTYFISAWTYLVAFTF